MTDVCACGHPRGWHYLSMESCLECSCRDFRARWGW